MKKKILIPLIVFSSAILLTTAVAAGGLLNGTAFRKLITPEKYDFNENGYADMDDAAYIKNYLYDIDYSAKSDDTYDANGDGKTDAVDYVMVKQYGNDYYTELWRAQYHYSPHYGAINDPNGLCFFKGKWHMFYQYSPSDPPSYGNTMWGHAVSDDLVHWEELAPALLPYEDVVIWSGTAWWDKENRSGLFDGIDDGGMLLSFSTQKQTYVGFAYSADGQSFTILDTRIQGNPDNGGFRDPKLFFWEEENIWVLNVGTGVQKLYYSKNFIDWSTLSESATVKSECPDLFKMTVKETGEEVWIFTGAGQYFYVVDFSDGKLNVLSEKISLHCGVDAYAGITFANEPNGRTLMMNWGDVFNNSINSPNGRWTAGMTLITEMTLHCKDGEYYMTQTPAAEYDSIIGEPVETVTNITLSDGENTLNKTKSQIFKAHLEIDVANTEGFDYKFCVGDGEETVLTFDKSKMTLTLERSESIYGGYTIKEEENPVIMLDGKFVENGILDIDIYCDVSYVEIFACGGRYVAYARIQPFTTSTAMSLIAKGSLKVVNATVSPIESIWNDSDETYAVNVAEKEAAVDCTETDGYFLRASSYLCKDELTVTVKDDSICCAETVEGGIMIYGKKAGETTLLITSGNRGANVKITVTGQK